MSAPDHWATLIILGRISKWNRTRLLGGAAGTYVRVGTPLRVLGGFHPSPVVLPAARFRRLGKGLRKNPAKVQRRAGRICDRHSRTLHTRSGLIVPRRSASCYSWNRRR